MSLSETERKWYFRQIEKVDPNKRVVKLDEKNNLLIYDDKIRSDEDNKKRATDEEVVRALALCILASKDYKYPVESFYIERYFEHGSISSQGGRDEIDLIIYDDDLPFAMWEFKSAEDYDRSNSDRYIRFQLFGSAPLIGTPKLLVYATIKPVGNIPTLKLISVDRTKHLTNDDWIKDERPHTTTFPPAFTDPQYEPFTFEGNNDLRLDCTQADFKAVAATFHNEFFGEHPDTVLFANLVKCLLAKIYDERQTKIEDAYRFQVFYKKRRAESAQEVFERINELYKTAYERYIDRNESDEINPKEFSPERVKTVVIALQGMSITRGAALHGDVVGAFF